VRLDLALTRGAVVSSAGGRLADVGIKGGRIVAVGSASEWDAAETVDCQGLHVLPGAIDTQVHFREPGLTHKEDFESGSRAAVMGGVTTFFDEPNTDPPTTTAEALADKMASAEGRSWANFAFWVGATMDNIDRLAELEELPGTPGIGEVFMASSTGPLLIPDDGSLRRVLQNGRLRVAVHAEDEERINANRERIGPSDVSQHPLVRDAESSRLATERILRLSRETGRPVHILHVSTKDELPLLHDAKAFGASCEVTPQHLTFCDEDYPVLGAKIQMNTPIRSAEHRDALRRAFSEGLFDVVASDHAPHTMLEKSAPYPDSPSGMPGVQTLLPVLLDLVGAGLARLEDVVRMTAENPARLFGVVGKGQINPGYDADLAVVDLDAAFKVERDWLQSKCGWSPFEGRALRGRVVHTLVGGRFAVREGQLAEPGLGTRVEFAKNAGQVQG
jgi:dihydroorotase